MFLKKTLKVGQAYVDRLAERDIENNGKKICITSS